jgi:hypothetical protein
MNRLERKLRRFANRRHVPSAHLVGAGASPVAFSIDAMLRRAAGALIAAARRWMLNRQLEHINYQILHAQAIRADVDHGERLLYERQALVKSALRASVPGAAVDHETEQLVN